MNIWMDGCLDGFLDGRMFGWMDGWIDRYMDIRTNDVIRLLKAAGLAMLGFGIWMKVDPEVVANYLAFLTTIEGQDPLVSYVAILFITIGAFAVFVGFLGLCGAYNDKKPMLALVSSLSNNRNRIGSIPSISPLACPSV